MNRLELHMLLAASGMPCDEALAREQSPKAAPRGAQGAKPALPTVPAADAPGTGIPGSASRTDAMGQPPALFCQEGLKGDLI